MPVFINAGIILVFSGVSWFASKRKPLAYVLLFSASLLGMLGYILPLYPHWFVRVFPFADAVFYSNLFPYAVALMAPAVFRFSTCRNQSLRLIILLSLLFGASLYPYRYFNLPSAYTDQRMTIDQDGICRQSGADTCGAAALVTLLRFHGIDTTETEVVRLALTKAGRGSQFLGQYHALKTLTAEPGYRIVLARLSAEELCALQTPALITVGVPKKADLKSPEVKILVEKCSWTPGVMHDVVYLGADEKDSQRIKIGDPDFGLEKWKAAELHTVYQGYALYLERK